MSVNVQEVHDLLAKKFNATGQSQLFETTFLYALKRVLLDMQNRVGVSLDAPSNVTTDLDCADEYYPVIVTGCILYVQDMGFFGQDKDNAGQRQDYMAQLAQAHTYYMGTQTVYTGVRGEMTDDDDED